MGHFSVETYAPPGSHLSANQQTIVTSQLPTASWHHAIGDSTYADAILDRLLHNAHRVELEGDSLRRTRASISD